MMRKHHINEIIHSSLNIGTNAVDMVNFSPLKTVIYL